MDEADDARSEGDDEKMEVDPVEEIPRKSDAPDISDRSALSRRPFKLELSPERSSGSESRDIEKSSSEKVKPSRGYARFEKDRERERKSRISPPVSSDSAEESKKFSGKKSDPRQEKTRKFDKISNDQSILGPDSKRLRTKDWGSIMTGPDAPQGQRLSSSPTPSQQLPGTTPKQTERKKQDEQSPTITPRKHW